jgi:hypothetical protein
MGAILEVLGTQAMERILNLLLLQLGLLEARLEA